jgi:translation initiation factor IF-3
LPEVFLIDETGEKRGVMPTSQAIALAQAAGLDLVEVSPQARPPVAKIIDFGKLQYEKEKQQRKSKSTKTELKGIRLGANIGDHDIQIRAAAGQKFLDKGHKLKIELQLRGRQKAHPEVAEKTMNRYLEVLERDVNIEQPIKRLGGRFSMIVSAKRK